MGKRKSRGHTACQGVSNSTKDKRALFSGLLKYAQAEEQEEEAAIPTP